MKTKKLLSLLLALMMMLSVVPMYASAAPIALTVANVTEWPTAVGEMYVGQIVGEHITITGGEVRYDADGDGVLEDTEIVPGHFEHFNATLSISLASDASKANIKFVPDDSTAYSGFNKLMSTDVTYVVKKTTAVLMDEANPPVATPIKEGQTLSESIISGGTMKNPYNEKLNLSSKVWAWVDPTQVITESGEYLAKWEGDTRAYEDITDYIYVEVEKDQKATELKTMPVVNFDYNPNLTWESYDFVDATAVVVNSDTYVSGTFSVVESMINTVPRAGSYEIEVTFTPDDTDNYVGFTVSVPVTVNPLPISFKGNDGNFIVDGFEVEVEPGTLMRDVQSYLMAYLNYPPQSVIGVEDRNSYAENGRTYKLTVQHENTNYVGTEVSFTVKFKEVEFTPTFKSGYLNSAIDCGDYSPAGTFTVSLDGKEIAVVKENEQFTYTVENSGDHVLSAKYNPVENDYFVIADATKTVNVKLQRTVNRINCTSNGGLIVTYGDTVEISANANAENFDRWVITDASGNEVDLGVDLTQLKITFTMPDYDITVEAKTKSGSGGTDGGSGGIDDIFGGLDMDELTQGDSEWAIINIIRNIIAKFKSFLQQLIETFQSIGD